MKTMVICSHRRGALRLTRWAVCLLPLLFAGCFDTEPVAEKSTNGKSMGIAAISRFFPSGQTAPTKPPETNVASEVMGPVPDGISAFTIPESDFSESGVAVPDYLGSNQGVSAIMPVPVKKSVSISNTREPDREPGFATMASLVLNSPFSQLFSSIFKSNKSADALPAAKDVELLNPFTEAKQEVSAALAPGETKAETQTNTTVEAASKPTTSTETETSTETPTQAETQKSEPVNSSVAPTGAGFPADGWFMILGDFDGSGIMNAMPARRSSDTKFVSEDGEREFSLVINAAAAMQQSGFYIDDMNGDGNPDILVTKREALSGGVMFGDGKGGYQLTDWFLTGYEPTIPSAGPFRNGKREIVTFSSRTGELKTFHATDKYRMTQTQKLAFAPDYLLHLVATDTSHEFLRAAHAGGPEQILRWKDDGSLEAIEDKLPEEPLILSLDFGSDLVQAYQVGGYASVLLTSQRKSFNVANLRLSPGIFLVIGDLYGRGYTDVAVGHLEFFTPGKSLH